MPNHSLSKKADETLNIIYKEYQTRKTSYYMKTFSITSLFPKENNKSNNSETLSALIELSKLKMIKFYTDRRIILNNEAISYIENKLGKNKIC